MSSHPPAPLGGGDEGLTGHHNVPEIGLQLGPYRIVELLGQGGMGRIFLAERDDAYRQQVAIKILRRGLDSEEMRWRFRRERQILASLEHPYIARLYDGGTTDDGRPYLVMERVEGSPIDAHCDDRRLNADQRLRLFVKVCQAVAVAHRNLLVHRDLKPNNILVGDDGTPKLLDFGIAKPLIPIADPAETQGEQGPLTPGYASPEQVLGGSLTTASDVYALGVLLHRLLCGRGPQRTSRDLIEARPMGLPSRYFDEPTQPEEMQRIATRRQTTVEGLRRRLSGDLDDILLKALNLVPGERYPSAQELSRDIERHLAGLPVSARPEHPMYLVGKFLSRNRRTTAVLTSILIVLLAGLLSVEVARRQADVERRQAQQVQDFLVETFDGGDSRAEGPPLTPKQWVDLAVVRLRRHPPMGPRVEVALLDALSQMYSDLAHYDEAYELATEGLVKHRQAYGAEHVDTAPILEHLAHIELRRGQLAAAELHFDEALRLAGLRWENRHQKRAAEVAGNNALYGLSSVRWDQGRRRESEELLRRTLEQRRTLYEAPHRRIADVASDLATLLIADQRFDEGEALLREALEMRHQSLGKHHPDMFFSMDSLALLHFHRGDLDAAEETYQRTLMLQSELLSDDHPHRQLTRLHLARTWRTSGKLEEAHDLLSDLVATERLRSPESPTLAAGLQLLGRVLSSLERSEEALPYLQEALERNQRRSGVDNVGHAFDLFCLAQAEAKLGREIGVRHYREAARLLALHDPDQAIALAIPFELSQLLLKLDRPAEALEAADDTLARLDAGPPQSPWRRHAARAVRGAALLRLDRLTEAEPILRDAYRSLSEILGEGHVVCEKTRQWIDELELRLASGPPPAQREQAR